jgi:hypothetical protein
VNGSERTTVFTLLHCSFRQLKYIETPVTPKNARVYNVRGATQKFGKFKQRARTVCRMPFRR